MSDIAVRVENVHKDYKLYQSPAVGPIKDLLFPWTRARNSTLFPAVRNVSFEVRRGEIIGIIGPNGAGKTTLLKMIAGLLPVDGGRIEVNGTITALLALGVGVHPEFSGRDNILYGAMLLGVPKATVLARMDEIVAFADIGPFIDQPFRTYSSGMRARLLFAISMSISPDILIVDEALATGDAQFLSKSRQKILELCKSGATILFVSHNVEQIREICGRCLLLYNGTLIKDGASEEVIAEYFRLVDEKNRRDTPRVSQHRKDHLSNDEHLITVLESGMRSGNTMMPIEAVETGESIVFDFKIRNKTPSKQFHVYLGFYSEAAGLVAEMYTRYAISEDAKGTNYDRKAIPIDALDTLSIELAPFVLFNGYYQTVLMLYCAESNIKMLEYRSDRYFYAGISRVAPSRRDIVCSMPLRCISTSGANVL